MAAFLVFADDPAASLADVAKRAGVGRATLHRHFPGRPELMRALAKIAMTELDKAIEEALKGYEIYQDQRSYEVSEELSAASFTKIYAGS